MGRLRLVAVDADYLTVDNTDRVETFLTEHPGRYYCNRCLSDELLVINATQVNHVTRSLQNVTPYRHGKMICARRPR